MLKQLHEKLQKARADLAKVFDEAGAETDFDKVKSVGGSTAEKIAAVRKMNDDIESLQKQVKDIDEVEAMAKRNSDGIEAMKAANRPPHPSASSGGGERKASLSLGELIVKSGATKSDNRRKEFEIEGIELKTLFETTAGWSPESLRTGRLVDKAVRPIQVLDLIPMGRTSMAAIKYMEETTLTETNAVEKAEGSEYGEVAMALTERSVTVEKLPCFLPVTDEQLEDVEQAQSYINNRLPEILKRRLDYQSLNGTGVTPLMLGILQKSGIQVTAAGAEDGNADTILRAINNVRVTGRAIASAIVLHPTDWLNERLRKTKDGAYVWGNPSETGITTMWGLPVAQSDSLTAGTAVVGDYRLYSEFVERRGIVVKVSDSHSDYFIKGKQAIRADLRGAFVWYRAAAFSSVTLPG